MPLPSLMVLNGDARTTVGIVRSLGRRGIPIIVGSNHFLGMAGYSRYAREHFTYPDPAEDFEAAHAMVFERVRAWKPDILMPVFDEGWSIIHEFYDDYARLTNIVPNPGRELYNHLSDKSYMADWAISNGIEIPKTFNPITLEDAITLRTVLPYPVLLKPKKSVSGKGIRMAKNQSEFAEVLERFNEVPIIQEKIEGENLELTIFCDRGKPMAGSVYLSLRNSPLPYGPPVACRTIKDEALLLDGVNFLQKLQYHGVAHLDFRRDHKDGKAKLLDFNTRIAGSNDASLQSGVDFAYMQYRLAQGEKIEPCFQYEVGREFRWYLMGELKHLFQTRHKRKTIQALLTCHHVSCDISLADPLPNIMTILTSLRNLYRKS